MHKWALHFFFLTFFSMLNSYAQTDTAHKTKSNVKKKYKYRIYSVDDLNANCIQTSKYSIAQRLKKYPFNNAFQILAVSYPGDGPMSYILHVGEDKKHVDSIHAAEHWKAQLHFKKNGTVDSTTLIEIKTLNRTQTESLTNIIYNIKDAKWHISVGNKCFPIYRNALVYIDKKGKVFDYIEICFHCGHWRSKSNKLSIGDLCDQKFQILQNFFASIGVKHGLRQDIEDENIDDDTSSKTP